MCELTPYDFTPAEMQKLVSHGLPSHWYCKKDNCAKAIYKDKKHPIYVLEKAGLKKIKAKISGKPIQEILTREKLSGFIEGNKIFVIHSNNGLTTNSKEIASIIFDEILED